MSTLRIYFNDNECQIIKDKIYTFTSNSLNNSMIINEKQFIQEFKSFLKLNKLISNILYSKFDIYINFPILEKDKIYYEYLFDKMNFSFHKIISIHDILPKKTYLIYNNHSIYYLENGITYTLNNSILSSYLKTLNNKLYIFGNKNFNHSESIIFSNHSTYIVDLISKEDIA